ncbi:MAG: hypothetical protein IT366_05210 [Candidatus Hydrogenedentes bacterium]|nr:hypothetical protein [Candidatus Hydrogenedentota bacterium]
MPAHIEDELARLYGNALQHLSALLHAPDATRDERERARDALMRLHRAYATTGIKNLEQRAAELNALAAVLRGITNHTQSTANRVESEALRSAAEEARRLLVRVAREAFPESDARDDDNPDVIETAPPNERDDRDGSAGDEADDTESRVAPDRAQEYRSLFDTCIALPDKVSKVNWYANKLMENRLRYEFVGNSLKIPWWFIGAIHGLESGFAFDRHLHNGDPLTARTRRVPAGRPVAGNAPFTWEQSAQDALRYMKLDQWGDWSVAGALYQWEAYNGFGYRKYKISSPYLWSFSNHYDKGRYVRDHVFDTEAVSNQCGAATLLRALMNQGAVQVS